MPAPLRSSSRLRVLKQGAAATDGLFIVQNEKKKATLKKKIEYEEKTRCSCCRCIAQYAHSNKSLVGITCDISAVITQIGAGDGQYIRRQAQSLFTPLRNPLLSHCTQTPRAENLRQAHLPKILPW